MVICLAKRDLNRVYGKEVIFRIENSVSKLAKAFDLGMIRKIVTR